MGFRRLRARLDQVQGEANYTLGMAQDLIADLQDGFGITITVDANAVKKIAMILAGTPGKLPLRIKIDPQIDA
jgi:hypothetical protein